MEVVPMICDAIKIVQQFTEHDEVLQQVGELYSLTDKLDDAIRRGTTPLLYEALIVQRAKAKAQAIRELLSEQPGLSEHEATKIVEGCGLRDFERHGQVAQFYLACKRDHPTINTDEDHNVMVLYAFQLHRTTLSQAVALLHTEGEQSGLAAIEAVDIVKEFPGDRLLQKQAVALLHADGQQSGLAPDEACRIVKKSPNDPLFQQQVARFYLAYRSDLPEMDGKRDHEAMLNYALELERTTLSQAVDLLRFGLAAVDAVVIVDAFPGKVPWQQQAASRVRGGASLRDAISATLRTRQYGRHG